MNKKPFIEPELSCLGNIEEITFQFGVSQDADTSIPVIDDTPAEAGDAADANASGNDIMS